LIQGLAQARNIDSKQRSAGFDNCSFAAQRRVLQRNPPKADKYVDAEIARVSSFGQRLAFSLGPQNPKDYTAFPRFN
jgi:hypothetical protein